MTPHAHTLSCALAAAALAAGHAPAQSQPQSQPQSQLQPDRPRRPQAAERVVRVFDFEERLTNPLDIPQGWIRAQDDPLVPRDRPGFPLWNRAELDFTVAASGEGSARLEVEGGSASLRLKPGVIPIFPLGQYRITALVRSENLLHARPRLVVQALDGQGRPIPESRREALQIHPSSDWETLTATLPGLFEDAAYLQIDLEVVQPKVHTLPPPHEHHVWSEDFDGLAWFDDVTVTQAPQLRFATTAPLNVVTRPDRPVLEAELRDLAAENITAHLRIYDDRRRLIDASTRAITSGRERWSWTPDLPALGWYRATIELTAGERAIASTACDLVWLDPPAPLGGALTAGPDFDGQTTRAAPSATRDLAVHLSTLPPGEPAELARALRAMGASAVTLPVWERGLAAEDLPERVERLRDIVTELRGAWIRPRLSLPVVPERLAGALRLRPERVVDALAAQPSAWEPYLIDALDRLGATTASWRLGPIAAAPDDADPAALETARAQVARLVPGLELTAGRAATEPPPRDLIDRAVVPLPAWTSSAPLDLLTAPWRDARGLTAEYVLEPLSRAAHAERDVAADLARRAVRLAAAADNARPYHVALSDPWTIRGDETPQAGPGPEAAVLRTLSDRLSGRRFAAEWAVAPGVRCFVFAASPADPERGGLLVAWSESAPAGAELRAALAAGPVTVTDMWGNGRTVEPTIAGQRSEHAVPLTSEPMFIEGIDTELALFLLGLKLEPGRIQAVAGEQTHEIVVHNPWPVPASGRLFIAEPGGYDDQREVRDRSWEITPRALDFDIGPGETARLPIAISVSRAVEAGAHPFVFDVELTSARDYGLLRSTAPAEIAWDEAELEIVCLHPGASPDADVIIEAVITNTGSRARAFEAFGFAPGQPRARASIGAIEPGQSAVRYFAFPNAAGALAGQRVMVSIAEADGPGRLTKGVEVVR